MSGLGRNIAKKLLIMIELQQEKYFLMLYLV